MRSASVAMTPGVTAAYNWTEFPVIDIGGGIGTPTGLYSSMHLPPQKASFSMNRI